MITRLIYQSVTMMKIMDESERMEGVEEPADPELIAGAVHDVLFGRTKLKLMYEEARARYDANPMTEEDFVALEAIAPTSTDSQ